MLELKSLVVTAKGKKLLDGIDLKIEKGTAIGLTGQSGSGKTTMLKSIMGILSGNCKIETGQILLEKQRIDLLNQSVHRQLCGTTLGFIPQNPMTAFDPRIRIGKQLRETFRSRLKISTKAADELSEQKLKSLNLDDPARIKNS